MASINHSQSAPASSRVVEDHCTFCGLEIETDGYDEIPTCADCAYMADERSDYLYGL